MTLFTIRCIGFEEQQVDSISAIVDLAGSALTNKWSFSDAENSDVMMINMCSETGKQAFLEKKEILPEYRIILAAENSDDCMQGFWFLTKKNVSPPSLRELTDLFNQIGSFLSQLSEAKDETVIDQQEREADSEINNKEREANEDTNQIADKDARKLLAKNYLFGLILQAKKDKSCRIIKLKQYPVLYLSPDENYYCFDGTDSDLKALCSALPKQLKVKKISQRSLAKEEKKHANSVRKSLVSLKTQAVLEASRGRILEGHSPQADVMLTSMPDFDALPILAKYQNIAAHMIDTHINLFAVAENLKIPLSDVFDFYNVCYLFDIINIDHQSAKQQKAFENKNAKTLSSFLKSFFKKK